MNCAEGPYHTDSVYNGYSLLCIYCLELELQRVCDLCVFFSYGIKVWALYLMPCEDDS